MNTTLPRGTLPNVKSSEKLLLLLLLLFSHVYDTHWVTEEENEKKRQ
jgi:hypothetical protein